MRILALTMMRKSKVVSLLSGALYKQMRHTSKLDSIITAQNEMYYRLRVVTMWPSLSLSSCHDFENIIYTGINAQNLNILAYMLMASLRDGNVNIELETEFAT